MALLDDSGPPPDGASACSSPISTAMLFRMAIFISLSLATLFAGNTGRSAAREPSPREYDLKAAFLYHFAQFVDWPPEAFPSPDTPLVIGVLGVDPFGPMLDETVRNEIVKGRRLVVQRYRRVQDAAGCHILFVSASEAERFDEILASLKGKPILSVGDTADFAIRGGIIRFLTERNKIRLRINLESAKTANLTISSKLLRAAELVGRE